MCSGERVGGGTCEITGAVETPGDGYNNPPPILPRAVCVCILCIPSQLTSAWCSFLCLCSTSPRQGLSLSLIHCSRGIHLHFQNKPGSTTDYLKSARRPLQVVPLPCPLTSPCGVSHVKETFGCLLCGVYCLQCFPSNPVMKTLVRVLVT